MKTYYELLKISRTATLKEINSAWKKLALEHHPDRSNESASVMAEINNAHDILSDPVKRRDYDATLEAEPWASELGSWASEFDAMSQRRAQEEQRRRAQEEQRRRAQEEQRRRAQEEQRRRAQEEQRRRAQEEQRRKEIEEQRRKEIEERYADPNNDFTAEPSKYEIRQVRSKLPWFNGQWESEVITKSKLPQKIIKNFYKPEQRTSEYKPFLFSNYFQIRPYKSYSIINWDFLSNLSLPFYGLIKIVKGLICSVRLLIAILKAPQLLFSLPYKSLRKQEIKESEKNIIQLVSSTFSLVIQGVIEISCTPFNVLIRCILTLSHGHTQKFEEGRFFQEAYRLIKQSLLENDKYSLNVLLLALHKKCERSNQKGKALPFYIKLEREYFKDIENEILYGTLNIASTTEISSSQEKLIYKYLLSLTMLSPKHEDYLNAFIFGSPKN